MDQAQDTKDHGQDVFMVKLTAVQLERALRSVEYVQDLIKDEAMIKSEPYNSFTDEEMESTREALEQGFDQDPVV
jgi:hypothetical protein